MEPVSMIRATPARRPAAAPPILPSCPPSLAALFRVEAKALVATLSRGLTELLRDARASEASLPAAAAALEAARLDDCRRAAHSLRGSAAVIGLRATANLAATLENAFLAAREGRGMDPSRIVDLLRALEVLRSLIEGVLPAPDQPDQPAHPAIGALPLPARPPLQAPRAARSLPRILMVDDSRMARELGRRLFTERGFDVVAAADGWEAWGLLSVRDFDLLVTDAEMPGLGGIDLLRRLRADSRLAALPVILVTGKELAPEQRHQIEGLPVRVLIKQFGGESLLLDAALEMLGSGPRG